MTVNPIPPGTTGPVPYLVVNNCAAAIDFYVKAFGARELMRMPGPGGAIAHAEVSIGGGRIMLSDELQGHRSPKVLGGTPVSIFVYVSNVDATFKQALAAGATEKTSPSNMFWGDRWGMLTDPFGHEWHLATHVEDVTPQEMQWRMAQMT